MNTPLFTLGINNCSVKYTTWTYGGDGDMTYLSKHALACGSGELLSMFHLEKSRRMIRYVYGCCKLNSGNCKMKTLTSDYSYDGNGW